jgi:hypothetical protein
MAATPLTCSYFRAGQPLPLVGGKVSTSGLDFFLRSQPYRGVVVVSAAAAAPALDGWYWSPPPPPRPPLVCVPY